jgi:hypothetical protein
MEATAVIFKEGSDKTGATNFKLTPEATEAVVKWQELLERIQALTISGHWLTDMMIGTWLLGPTDRSRSEPKETVCFGSILLQHGKG